MRTFLVNFVYSSTGQSSNSDFVLFSQEKFPTPHEIYQQIKATATEKGLQVHGPLLWTGITQLTESDVQQFNFKEE
jgi:hypothetical protein